MPSVVFILPGHLVSVKFFFFVVGLGSCCHVGLVQKGKKRYMGELC